MGRSRFSFFYSQFISLLGVIGTLSAQTIDTGILGVVADSTGAVVAGAAVTITQPATGLTRTVVTNSEGYYDVRYLLPGDYTCEPRDCLGGRGFCSSTSALHKVPAPAWWPSGG